MARAMTAAVLLVTAVPSGAGGGESMIAAGERFVEFELPAHDGTTVRSSDLAGQPYLLFYYPKADTPG